MERTLTDEELEAVMATLRAREQELKPYMARIGQGGAEEKFPRMAHHFQHLTRAIAKLDGCIEVIIHTDVKVPHEFLRDEDGFYSWGGVVDLMNQLKKRSGCVHEFDMYKSGEYLHFSVYRDQCEDLLSPVLSDIEAYRLANNEAYSDHDEGPNVIDLSLLVHMFQEETSQRVLWDKHDEYFYLQKM